MQLTNLIPAKFLKRYKRFFIDGELSDGKVVTAHCPNTGSMKTLLDEAHEVWLRYEENPKRKLKYTAEVIKLKSGALALINTQRPNVLVEEYLLSFQSDQSYPYELPRLPKVFQGVEPRWNRLKREVKYGRENSKIDIWGEKDGTEYFVEVKNLTLMDSPHWGSFPDSVTQRGQKHLRELTAILSEDSHIPILCFLASRTDLQTYGIATHIDSNYAALYQIAKDTGVGIWVPQLRFKHQQNQDGTISLSMYLGEELSFRENPHR